MEYYVVFQDYGDDGLEAIVDPVLTRAQIVARIKTREFDNIVQIDRICFAAAYGTMPQRIAEDVTKNLIDEAEAELAEPFGDDLALPAAVIPPVR